MSSIHKSLQNCPHCKVEQEVSYYQTVNITLNPELKPKVLSGNLNLNICTACGKEINIFTGFLYHDMKNRIMIELSMDESSSETEEKKEIIDNLAEHGYIFRRVTEYGRLIEKINIFDNNLNDEIIQTVSDRMKEMLDESIKSVVGKSEDYSFHVVFNAIEKGLFKKRISFHCFTHPSQVMKVKYDFKNLTPEEKANLYNLEKLRS